MSEVKSTFEQIQERFDAGADLGDLAAVYVFKLGDDAGDWTLRIADGKGSVEEGAAEDGTCTINVSAENFVNMVSKKANPQMLFMTGKLKVTGNMGQALKLQKVLG
ncbi:MAG TPA: sterol-binding protein [Myxococcales bacterium]|nr:sterol-binding protein [Deltaproteobacteria bacterium]MBU54451.1 sterol-binding protein [Deltaproteobacteria bacterium]HAA54279.1 sterol-binding protein [Myxococcales bacterium]|tara:strand:+ start:489 stop:806 length:318 start_codon:yes stop_codon:yes gene_type:complete